MEYPHIKWECTDPDAKQYGRKISENHYQFKERKSGPIDIYLDQYSDEKIEDIINSYGYTLYKDNEKENYIQDEYEDYKWIIAECIFESEEAPPRTI